MLVALRKESVDRNVSAFDVLAISAASLSARRAWIEIFVNPGSTTLTFPSLSARRAWIEISGSTKPKARRAVALRKESVDRNAIFSCALLLLALSLSARRAWIEISLLCRILFRR